MSINMKKKKRSIVKIYYNKLLVLAQINHSQVASISHYFDDWRDSKIPLGISSYNEFFGTNIFDKSLLISLHYDLKQYVLLECV